MWSNPFEASNYLTEEDIDNFSLTGNRPQSAPTGFTAGQQRLYVRAFLEDNFGIPAPHRVTPQAEQQHYGAYQRMPQYRAAQGQISAYIGQLAAMGNEVI